MKRALLFLLILAVVTSGSIIYIHRTPDSSVFGVVCALVFMYAILIYDWLYGREQDQYLKMINNLPCDHHFVSILVSVIDVGNYRFLYSIYAKSGGPFAKSYVSMHTMIPFPLEDKSAKESLRLELQKLVNTLQNDGYLTDHTPFNAEDYLPDSTLSYTCIGQPLFLEFPRKIIDIEWLKSLQENLLTILEKYSLQNHSYCTIHGRETGTEYRYIEGNMFTRAVFKGESSAFRYAHKKMERYMCLNSNESLYPVDQFIDLYNAVPDTVRDYSLDNLKRTVKSMFKNKKKRVNVSFEYHRKKRYFCVSVSLPHAISDYIITYSSGYWWIFADGRIETIEPISTEDESVACEILLHILYQYA